MFNLTEKELELLRYALRFGIANLDEEWEDKFGSTVEGELTELYSKFRLTEIDKDKLLDYVISQYSGIDTCDLEKAEKNILNQFERMGLVRLVNEGDLSHYAKVEPDIS